MAIAGRVGTLETSVDVLKMLFERRFRSPAVRIQALDSRLSGSGRKLLRLSGGGLTAIGVLYDIREENIAFVAFSKHFRSRGLPVAEIYGSDLERGAYLEEDLGDTTLFDVLSANRVGENIAARVIEAYRKVVAVLPRFQVEAGRSLDYSVCYPRASFDRQSIAWDLNYFKYYFLRLAGVPFNEQALEDDFGRLTDFLLQADSEYFLYRDFQSRNIMLQQDEPWFVDYQGGRRGALQYDVASLLFDAKADLPPQLRGHLLAEYLGHVSKFIDLKRDVFMRYYYAYVYVRLMQAMGAYGFRGFYEQKTHFLQSVPYALKSLHWLLDNVELPIPLPTLMVAFRAMLSSEKLLAGSPSAGFVSDTQNLAVQVFSFSFHRTAPKDETGNGGGFVFDARSLPNPGREERFRSLTGKDAPVVDYLSRDPTVRQFLANAIALVDSSLTNYQSRGFKNLMVSFGCTGGQHRSVFLAEELAKHLRSRNGVNVLVRHLELEKQGK